ncbi:MAG: ATP-binding protein, partial [Oceanobacter sp.]
SVQISLQWSGQWSSGEPQGWPVIHVDDDGPGIPADKREALLQPFARMDASRSRDTGGFGLGLAIVHQIMQRHGGRVDISDSPLGGARFSIRWPERQGQEQ